MTGEREARMALAALAPLGAEAFAKALLKCGPVELWQGFLAQADSNSWGRKAALVDLPALQRATDAVDARFVIPGDDEWPAGLDDLDRVSVGGQAGCPVGLWVRGNELNPARSAVALVGARAASSYGEQVTVAMAADLAADGISIVSGMAFGIDAAAHRGALGVRGRTVAVVASGVDQPYPAAHADLARAIRETGSLISELPPGVRPTKYAFLARNRIIAALADAVVVVEAALRSGAKNTASWASGLLRPLLAVPGPITSSLSATPNRLLRDGEAILATGASDVMAALSPTGVVEEETRGDPQPIDRLRAELREVREAIGAQEEVTMAELSARTGQAVMDLLGNIWELLDLGWVEEADNGAVRLPGRRGTNRGARGARDGQDGRRAVGQTVRGACDAEERRMDGLR